MKINFNEINGDNLKHPALGLREKTGESTCPAETAGTVVSLTGNSAVRKSAGSYDSKGKTAEELMTEMSARNNDVMADYMTIMSNCTSGANYSELEKNGFCPETMDPEEAENILDHIKAEMVKAGVLVRGYNDDLKGVLGEETALARKKLESMDRLPDAAVEKLIREDSSFSVENLYMAKFRCGDNSPVREELTPEIEAGIADFVEQLGYEHDTKALEAAGWLYERRLPITVKNVERLTEIDRDIFPIDERQAEAAIDRALKDGMEPSRAEIFSKNTLWEKALEIKNETDRLMPETADRVPSGDHNYCLKQLFRLRDTEPETLSRTFPENKKGRLMLETARLLMTVKANHELLKRGFRIDVEPIEKVIEELKKEDLREKAAFFKTDDEALLEKYSELYEKTDEVKQSIYALPLAMAGRREIISRELSLPDIRDVGENLRQQYVRAGEAYETYGTKVRPDLGDRLDKTFEEAYRRLEELNLPADEVNRRAIRILGYNSMELSEENIETVREADAQLYGVLEKMTPAAVISLIREGHNPLEMSLGELDAVLDKKDTEVEMSRYAKYLLELESRKEITEAQRESYIGIYRFIRQISDTDGALTGQLIRQNAEITPDSLLRALRTRKRRGMDVRIDDEKGFLESISGEDKSISRQINAAYEAYRGSSQSHHDEKNDAYREEYVRQLSEAARMTPQVQEFLEEISAGRAPVTVMAAAEYLRDKEGPFAKLLRKVDKEARETVLRDAEALIDSFEDRHRAQEKYKGLVESSRKTVESAVFDADKPGYDEVATLGLLYRQVSFLAKRAEREEYDIPVTTETGVLSIHVKLVHGEELKGRCEASLESEKYGTISAGLELEGDRAGGIITCENDEGGQFLNRVKEKLAASLRETGINADDIYVTGGRLRRMDAHGTENVETAKLYRAAKAFVMAVREAFNEDQL